MKQILGYVYCSRDGILHLYNYKDISYYGNFAVVEHGNGEYSIYAHMQEFSKGLVTNQKIKQGDQLGIAGNTSKFNVSHPSNPLAVHLHFGIVKDITDGIFNVLDNANAIFYGKNYLVNMKKTVDPIKEIEAGLHIYPSPGRITSPYGDRPDMPDPFKFHEGVDFSSYTWRQ